MAKIRELKTQTTPDLDVLYPENQPQPEEKKPLTLKDVWDFCLGILIILGAIALIAAAIMLGRMVILGILFGVFSLFS